MDWTRCPEFAINFRIATNKTIFTHVNIVLHADIAGFPVRVIYAVSQSNLSLFPSHFLPVQVETDSEDNPDLNIFNGLSAIRCLKIQYAKPIVINPPAYWPTDFFNFQKIIENPGWGIFQGGLIRAKGYEITDDTRN